MKSFPAMFTVFVAILAWCGLARAGFSYDAVADFSLTANTESSAWSYRYSADRERDGVYERLTTFSDNGDWNPAMPYWHTGSPVPAVGANTSGASAFAVNDPYYEWPDGTIGMHPGDGGIVVVSWLSPADAVVDIDFTFFDIDPNGGDGVDWIIDVNDSAGVLAFGYLSANSTGPMSLPGVSVRAGDRINFIVDPHGDFGADTTGFTAAITSSAVPAPSCLPLLCSGLLVLAATRTRKSR